MHVKRMPQPYLFLSVTSTPYEEQTSIENIQLKLCRIYRAVLWLSIIKVLRPGGTYNRDLDFNFHVSELNHHCWVHPVWVVIAKLEELDGESCLRVVVNYWPLQLTASYTQVVIICCCLWNL